MLFFLLAAMLIIVGGGAETSEGSCDPHELKVCVDATPRTQVGLPRTKEELDKHCSAYHTGMSCMDKWIKRCLPTDGQKLVQQQIGGARALMRYLCSNDTALRRALLEMIRYDFFTKGRNVEFIINGMSDFLKEPSCWSMVSPDWSRCVDELQLAARDISERSHHIVYFNKNTELCCARDAFVSCVGHAGRACSSTASALLRRMAWVLAQDMAACSRVGEHPRAPCAAPRPPQLSALLSLLYYVYYY